MNCITGISEGTLNLHHELSCVTAMYSLKENNQLDYLKTLVMEQWPTPWKSFNDDLQIQANNLGVLIIQEMQNLY